jgi:hypothetical protein
VQTVYKWWAGLILVAVVLQIGFAGYGAFYVANKVDNGTVNQDKFDDGFGIHAGFGYLVVLLILIGLIIAAVAGVRGRQLGRAGALFGLGILQILLAWFGFDVPAIGFFHPINAFVILGLALMIAWTEGKAVPARTAEPAT